VRQLFETAQLMPPEVRPQLAGELICYGRSVVGQEWPAMQSRADTSQINPWGFALFRTLQSVEPKEASEQSAYDSWLSLTSSREEARRDRLHAAEGIVPPPVWFVLLFSAVLILVYLLFFADSGESVVVQGMMAGTVTAVIVATLLVLVALNRPYEQEIGGLRPVAMERSLTIMNEVSQMLDITATPPCDATGNPT